MNKRSHPLRPRRPIALSPLRSEAVPDPAESDDEKDSETGLAPGSDLDSEAELESDWDSETDSRSDIFPSSPNFDVVVNPESDSDSDLDSGEVPASDADEPRVLALELPALIWQWAKLQANMVNADSVESYCRRLLIEAIESHRAQVRIEGVSSSAAKPDRVMEEVRYLADWPPRPSAGLPPQAFADSPMASPNVFSDSDPDPDPNPDIQFEEAEFGPRSPSAAQEVIYRDSADGQIVPESENEDVSEFKVLLRTTRPDSDFLTVPDLERSETGDPDADADSDVVEIRDENEAIARAIGRGVDADADADAALNDGDDQDALAEGLIMSVKPVPSGPAVARSGGRPWAPAPAPTPTVALSPYREIVLRHAAPGVDDPVALLPALRRGEAIHPEFVQGLLDALRVLEERLANADSIDRKLAFALHRLAFEGQILATDAWNHAPDPTTIDVLRWVQEAVDRVLSGEDIRY